MKTYDVVVIGAGAAGMMCAIEAGKRARSVLIIEHNKNVGEKIRISGGGRCNFTHMEASHKNYLSANPKFAISALSQFTPPDFVALMDRHQIAWHQKAQGQLFCDGSARQVIDMLEQEMDGAGVEVWTGTEVRALGKHKDGFLVSGAQENISCQSLVVACGGKSIPKMGASNFGYRIAEQFGLGLVEARPGLVPLTFAPSFLREHAPFSGVSVEAVVRCEKISFREALLFTHRGLSGPVILQISSYWREGEHIEIDMAPCVDVLAVLKQARRESGRQKAVTALSTLLPKRLAQMVAGPEGGRLGDLSNKVLETIAERVKCWRIKPTGTEGYRTAEVTLGGVDTLDLDARTLEAKKVPGLFFVGEVVDITGWLGGYNFQWAWSSGYAAGQVV